MIWGFVVLVIVIVILAVVTHAYWIHSLKLLPNHEDALIVLGYQCKDNRIPLLLKERLDSTLRLDAVHQFPIVILSGGSDPFHLSEAEIMKQYLVSHGMDQTKIVLETQSRDTIENLYYSKRLMVQRDLHSCVILSNSFHLRRIAYIARAFEMNATYYADRSFRALIRQIYPTLHELRTQRITTHLLKKAQSRNSFWRS